MVPFIVDSKRAVHFITSCTLSKAVKYGNALPLSECSEHPELSPAKWLSALSQRAEKGPALEVYTGDHWSVSKDILENYAAELWVLSAGYGLINARNEIASYDATFSTGNINSVCNNLGLDLLPQEQNRIWWNELTLLNDNSLSLTELFERFQNDIFIIAAAPTYINVVKQDIKESISSRLLSKDNLLVITSLIDKDLQDFSVVTREKVRTHKAIGGSMVSLHTRVARHLLKSSKKSNYSIANMKEEYQALEKQSSDIEKKPIKKLSDDEVLKIIEDLLVELPDVKLAASVVLRRFREKGYSCEQKRFSRLFKTAIRFVVE